MSIDSNLFLKQTTDFLDDKKFINISVMDLRKANTCFDFFIIASGKSKIQCRSVIKELLAHCASLGYNPYNPIGLDTEWIIIDTGNIIIHLFTEEARNHYDLDRLWKDSVIQIP